MLADRNAGMRISQLADKYRISTTTVERRLHDAIHARLALTVDAYRESQNALLDETAAQIQRNMDAADEMVRLGITHENAGWVDRGLNQRAKAIDAIVRLAERRARLNGLDAPIQVTQTVTMVQGGVDAELERLTNALGMGPIPTEAPVNGTVPA